MKDPSLEQRIQRALDIAEVQYVHRFCSASEEELG